MAGHGEAPKEFCGIQTLTGLSDRPRASVRVDRIQAAFDMWTS
jgi:hypothetical protein